MCSEGAAPKTWNKPVAAAVAGAAASYQPSEQQPAPAAARSNAAAPAPVKKPRKQWAMGPVAGADGLIPPSYSSSYPVYFDDDAAAAADAEMDADDAQYDEDFDAADEPQQQKRAAPGNLQLRGVSDSIHEDFSANSTGGAAAESDSSVAEAIAEDEAERNLPMSPPPLALRKKDVSLLRESLEFLQQGGGSNGSGAAISLNLSSSGVAAHYRPPVPVHHAAPSVATHEVLYTDTLVPATADPSASSSSSSSAAAARADARLDDEFPPPEESDDHSNLPVGMLRPTSSSSPTLPSRNLSSSSMRRAAAEIGSPPRGSGAAAAVSAQQQQPDSAREVVNVRTSVSFAGDNLRASTNERPSTPLNTDSVRKQRVEPRSLTTQL